MIIRTTVMTGYPGETEEDFQELLAFVREMNFDRLGAFAFSPEPGTPAFDLRENFVSAEVAEARRKQLLDLQKGLSRKRNQALVGTAMRVLVEARIKKGVWLARSAADAPEVDPTVTLKVPSDRLLRPGQFVRATVTRADDYDLTAQLLP